MQAQDLAAMMRDMIKSSLNEFASQLGSDPGGKEEPSQDKEAFRDREPSRDLEDSSKGEEGGLASDHLQRILIEIKEIII